MPAIQLMPVSGSDAVQTAETSGAKTQKTQGLQGTFTNYMRQNSSSMMQTSKQQNVMPKADVKTQGTDSSVQQQYEQCQGKAAAQADKVSSADGTQSADTDTVAETVDEAVEEIKEILKENLGVDDEQIEAAMELLGLTQADLLNPQQLTALAAQLTGSENPGMMLFHENFQQVLADVNAVTQDLLKELGISMDELVTKLSETTAADVQPQETADFVQTLTAETQPQETVQPQQVQVQPETAENTAESAKTEVPKETASVQVQNTAQTEEAQPGQDQVQEEVQPQQVKQVQQEKTGQDQSQTGQGETAENSQDQTLMQKQTVTETSHMEFSANVQPQETAVHAPQAQQNTAAQAPLPQIPMQEVIDQIVEYTKINLSQDTKSIEMQLNPENLGKVYLHVSEKQGTVTAQLTAQNENIKEALVQQAAILKENLNQQGIKVDAVEVSAGTHEFESNLEKDAQSQQEQARQQEEQNTRRSRRNINLNDLNGISGIDGLSGLMSEEERLAAQIMRDNGNNVDFKA